MPREATPSLDDWMDDRRVHLGMGWDDVAREAGVSRQTLLNIRRGGSARTSTLRNIERALQWEPRSIDAIRAGGAPIPLPDPVEDVASMSLDDLTEAFTELARDLTDEQLLEIMARTVAVRRRARERETKKVTG